MLQRVENPCGLHRPAAAAPFGPIFTHLATGSWILRTLVDRQDVGISGRLDYTIGQVCFVPGSRQKAP
jgi:hypothetical protein